MAQIETRSAVEVHAMWLVSHFANACLDEPHLQSFWLERAMKDAAKLVELIKAAQAENEAPRREDRDALNAEAA